MKIHKIFKLITLILLIGQFSQQYGNEKSEQMGERLIKQEIKKLILNNVFWARFYIVSALADLPDKEQIKERLLKNQQGFTTILTLIYGNNAGDKLTNLFREHKSITVDLIEAIKINNKKQIKIIETKWYQNIKDIAVFLNKINPRLSVDYLYRLLSELLKLTKQEIVLRVQNKWEEDIQNFDKLLNYASNMSDNLANEIIKQFHKI